MAYLDQKIAKPTRYQTGESSRERMERLLQMSDYNPPADFDPDQISWVTANVAVTDWEGGVEAKEQGHFVICVAGEMPELGHVCVPIEPDFGRKQTIKTLELIANLIHWAVTEAEKKVVVHCAMGIERSVLSAVWYLHKYQSMTIDEAYNTVGNARPIAADRRCWIR